MNKIELLQHIRDRDEIGEAYVESQKEFLKWMTKRLLKET